MVLLNATIYLFLYVRIHDVSLPYTQGDARFRDKKKID
jgi:hypothetical protein